MDLRKVIESLRREKETLDRVIAFLEELQGAVTAAAPQKKRAAEIDPSHDTTTSRGKNRGSDAA